MSPRSPDEPPYFALVILKVAEPAGLKLAYRQPPPALVIPIIPGATTKRAFVHAVVAQVAGAVKAPEHIVQMPHGTGAGGRPLEAVVTRTAKQVHISWSIAASPPTGFGSGPTHPFSDKKTTGAPTSFQAFTSLADLTDAQFHDCVRKLKSREANHGRGQEDYFVMEVQYSYEQQQPQQKMLEDEDFLPLPPIAMSTTREYFYSPQKHMKKRVALPERSHSQQYEEDLEGLEKLARALPSGLMRPPPTSGGSHGRGLQRSRTQRLPTVKEEPEDGEENREQRTPRASEKSKGKGKEVDSRPLPLPKAPGSSPHRRRCAPASHDLKKKPGDDRPETYTSDVWGINKTILDTRIAAHKKVAQSPHDAEDDLDAVIRRSPSRVGKKSHIPIVPSFNISSPRGFGLKNSASLPSLSDDYKKRESASSSSSSSSSQKKDNPLPGN